ncbi:unnamed protein product [Prunus armeniaca]
MTYEEWDVLDEVLLNVMQATSKQTWESSSKCLQEVNVQQTLSQGRASKSLDGGGGNLMEHLRNFNSCLTDLQRMKVLYNTVDKDFMLLTAFLVLCQKC